VTQIYRSQLYKFTLKCGLDVQQAAVSSESEEVHKPETTWPWNRWSLWCRRPISDSWRGDVWKKENT